MTAPVLVALLGEFVNCFTTPGFAHFRHFVLAHAALWGGPHCVTETLRATLWHRVKHWTTPYVFLKRGRWSCAAVSRALLGLVLRALGVAPDAPLVVAIDDTLVKKWGRRFFGLGCYPDPTDKNPGASRRRVWGLCWVVLGLLVEREPPPRAPKRTRWFCFPLAALLFVPRTACGGGWPFHSKIELAGRLLDRLGRGGRRVLLVVDNLYAKAPLASRQGVTLVSRLRSNAALYAPPAPRRPGQRGAPRKRGAKVSARALWRRHSRRRTLRLHIYGKTVTIRAWVGVVIPSRTLGEAPILAVIFPQRSGKKMNVFFKTDVDMNPVRLLELYAARFKIEDAFDELKTHGGLGDCRQRSFRAHKRHVTLCLVAYSLLRVLSLTLRQADRIEIEPWWSPAGPPSVTRLRRALAKTLGIPHSLWSHGHPARNRALARAA